MTDLQLMTLNVGIKKSQREAQKREAQKMKKKYSSEMNLQASQIVSSYCMKFISTLQTKRMNLVIGACTFLWLLLLLRSFTCDLLVNRVTQLKSFQRNPDLPFLCSHVTKNLFFKTGCMCI